MKVTLQLKLPSQTIEALIAYANRQNHTSIEDAISSLAANAEYEDRTNTIDDKGKLKSIHLDSNTFY